MKKFINEIKLELNKLQEKSEEELTLAIKKIKNRAQKEPIDNFIIEWFALIREVASRTIGLSHFDIQLMAGLLLHQGKIVEMKTGEGKTLVSTLPVALNALAAKGVHVVTVNEYLAERDQKWMGKVYNRLGLTVGLVKSSDKFAEKQKSYFADITYTTNSEVVFDFLRDCSVYNRNEIVQRPFHFCLIDEIDSVLIDEARTPLILSSVKASENGNKLFLANTIAQALEKNVHFQLDEKKKDINLTELGYKEAKKRLGKNSLYYPEDPWILVLLNALKANYFFKLNKDYILLNGKIVIVDEFTGRIMEDRRWSTGLHESIEVKEQVLVGGGTKTKTSITYQNFFPLYPTLSGMSGTAKTTEKEFLDIYNLEVVVLPTVKPLIRKDLPDLIYQTELFKWRSVLEQSKKCFEKGQPILIGTSTIEKSEFLSELFRLSEIPHKILNAKPENVDRESEIIAQAGSRFAVTIATNMAGRGTDIILGGNSTFQAKRILLNILNQALVESDIASAKHHLELELCLAKKVFTEYNLLLNKAELQKDIKNLPYSLETCQTSLKELYQKIVKDAHKSWQKENECVKALGGLYVLGTERHETRRIDNQLRGRAGRQGDPGMSQFFVSLEDDLIQIFGGENIRKWADYFLQDKSVPLESTFLTKSLETAQKRVESSNYELRKNVFQYDNILNTQRKLFINARQQLMLTSIKDDFRSEPYSFEDFFLRYCEHSGGFASDIEMRKIIDPFSVFVFLPRQINDKYNSEIWINLDLRLAESNFYQRGLLKSTRATEILSIFDFYWTEHIERMAYIRETINWRSYGQQNPLVEYNEQAFRSFKLMLEQIRQGILHSFLTYPLN